MAAKEFLCLSELRTVWISVAPTVHQRRVFVPGRLIIAKSMLGSCEPQDDLGSIRRPLEGTSEVGQRFRRSIVLQQELSAEFVRGNNGIGRLRQVVNRVFQRNCLNQLSDRAFKVASGLRGERF